MSMTDMVIMPSSHYQAICDAVRAKTGDTAVLKSGDLAAAITGISGGGVSGIYIAHVTPEVDSNKLTIKHNLGTTDILMAAAFAETIGEITPTANFVLGKYWAKTDVPVRYSSSGNTSNYDLTSTYNVSNANATGSVPTSTTYWDYVIDNNTFEFNKSASAYKFLAGVTYTVIIIASDAGV